jgi:hypothetical protein
VNQTDKPKGDVWPPHLVTNCGGQGLACPSPVRRGRTRPIRSRPSSPRCPRHILSLRYPDPDPADPLPSQRRTPTCCPPDQLGLEWAQSAPAKRPRRSPDKSRVALELVCSVGHSRHDVASGRGRAPCDEAQPGHADAEQRRRRRGPDRRTSGIERSRLAPDHRRTRRSSVLMTGSCPDGPAASWSSRSMPAENS